MNPWITAQVVYLSVYLLAVYTGIGIAAGLDYEMNGTDSNARVYTTAESGVNIRTVVAYRKSTNERATSYLLSSSRPTFFVINENTGTISTTRKINQKVGYQFSLTVIAKFGRKHRLNRPLLVDVVRKNTDRPTFDTSSATFLIYQRAKIGKVFGRLIATDQSPDDYNRNLTYSIQMYSHPKVFGIDDNGYLRVTDHIPSGVRVLNFTALVSDNGYPVETSWQIVSVNISTIPALSKFCTVKESHSWQICWKYVPPSSQRYVYDIQVRHNGYTHNNSVVAGTEFCYSNALLDTSGKYYYRVQTRLGLDKSPFTDWREAVDKGPDCEIFDPCSVLHPCDNGGSCLTKPSESYALGDRYTCICPRGWEGTDCRTRDLCVYNTCKNHGTCIMMTPNRTRCVCPGGFSGEFCEFSDLCFSNDCLNNATCQVVKNTHYECLCPPFYIGLRCEKRDPCYLSPCRHGKCIAINDKSYRCRCDRGYTGPSCEIANICILSDPCKHGGSCIPNNTTPGTYTCVCTEHYTGTNCTQLNPCKFITCENGGTCFISDKPGQHCKCLRGFIGGECQREDTCYLKQPCKNGATCTMNDDNSYICHCTNGFTGHHCELIDPCTNGSCNPEKSNGCIRVSDTKYRCNCLENYTGDLCETAISDCLDNPCRNNGSCIVNDTQPGYRCLCKPGFYGVHCDEIDQCRDHDCKNGATCRGLNDGTFRCYCPAGFSGTRCETLTFCSSTTCLNGANCSNGARPSDTVCSCLPDYYGRQCEFFEFCSPENNACLNQGKCVIDYNNATSLLAGKQDDDEVYSINKTREKKKRPRREPSDPYTGHNVYNEFHCVCPNGYDGEFCEKKIEEQLCNSGEGCFNGGSCLPTGLCNCPATYTGDYCEQSLNACASQPCLNGGSCTPQANDSGFTCSCMSFYQGDLCQFNKSFCQDFNPCNDRSECIDTENYGYRCECKPSFSGVNCTIKASCRENIQKDDTGRYVWPATFYGRTAILPCNYAKRKEENASRPCIFNTTIKRAQWGRMDTSLCEKIGLGEASNAMKKLCSMTGDPKTLTAEQVANVTEKLEEIFSYSLKDKNIASNMVQVISNMLAANTTVMARSNEMNKTSERLTQLLEDFTANVTIPANSSVNVKSSNVILFADKISPSIITPGKSLKLTTAFENDQKRKLKFTIPSNALTTTNQESAVPERVQLIAYNNAKLYIEQNETDVDNVDSQSVIFVKVKGRELRNLTDPVTYTVPNVEFNKNHTCVYWDLKSRSWSTEGIVTKNIGTNQTVCESDHLTSFSLLLDPSPDNPLPEIHETVLTYISYIGCGISLFGIILTIITYGLFGCLHGDPSGRILLNLCSSLLFLNVAFLMASQVTTLEDKYNHTLAETLCIIVTILIHYFLLTTLAWMCVEALNMYQLLVTVFNIYHSRFMLKRVLAAWGIPALTVGITLGADIRNYKTEIGFCFLSYGNKTAFYVALLTPACIILFVNTVVFGMVTKVILKPKFKNRHQCTQNVTSIQVRGCFTVMVLLGVTWLFGPLAINEMKLIFNYFFCILNSLQGFFIFVFRCLLNPEAKMAWIQLIKMGTLKKKKGPRKSVDSSSNGMYGGGGGGGGGGGNGHLGNRWSQKTMTVDIRDSTNLKKLSKPANDNNGIYDPNVSYKSYGSDWDQRNGSTRRSDKSKPLEFTRL